MDIKVITFDLDGVYFPNGTANFIKSLGELGVSEEEAKRVYLKSPQMNQEYKRGKISDEQFWTWAISEWNLNLTWQEIVEVMTKGYSVDEKVVSAISKIRQLGYKTAICSNNYPARIKGLQKRFVFLDSFDTVVLSYEVGECKPDKKIFEELVLRSQEKAESIVFADDNSINLFGAESVGITTFVYESFEKYIKQLNSLGVKI